MQTGTDLEQRKARTCGDRVASDGGRDEERREGQSGLEGEVFASQVHALGYKDRGNQTYMARAPRDSIILNVYAALQPMHGKCANHSK